MTVIDEYLDKTEAPQRAELERIRKIVSKTVPDAQESISYGMPVYKYKGKYLIGFAAFKNHMSIFPGSLPIENLKNRLGDFKLAKGTIQFTIDNPIPESIVKDIVNIARTDITERRLQ